MPDAHPFPVDSNANTSPISVNSVSYHTETTASQASITDKMISPDALNHSGTVVGLESESSSVTDSISPPNGESNQKIGNGVQVVKLKEMSLKINEVLKGTTTKFKVVQIGCGVVGHAYAQAFKQADHDVVGVEASRTRIDALKQYYRMRHVSEDMSDESDVDFVLLSINTPLDPNTGALNMRYLWSSLANVSAILSASPNALVVVRSTVTLGFSAAYRHALEEKLDRRVPVCFQPEFLRAKSALEDALAPWQVVIGCTRAVDVERYVEFQRGFVDVRRISLCTVDEAEVMKIFHNSFNAAKISFWNQAGLLVEKISQVEGKTIDPKRTFHLIGKTCEGLLNPAYGLTPGHAYYGTCLPKDSAELAHMEKSYGMESSLFEQVVKVNDVMRAKDVREVLYGDNHADNSLFHQRSAPNDKPIVIGNHDKMPGGTDASNGDARVEFIGMNIVKSKVPICTGPEVNGASALGNQGVKAVA